MDDGRHLLLMGGVSRLSIHELLALKGHRPSFLHEHSTHGIIGCIGMKLKGLVKVG